MGLHQEQEAQGPGQSDSQRDAPPPTEPLHHEEHPQPGDGQAEVGSAEHGQHAAQGEPPPVLAEAEVPGGDQQRQGEGLGVEPVEVEGLDRRVQGVDQQHHQGGTGPQEGQPPAHPEQGHHRERQRHRLHGEQQRDGRQEVGGLSQRPEGERPLRREHVGPRRHRGDRREAVADGPCGLRVGREVGRGLQRARLGQREQHEHDEQHQGEQPGQPPGRPRRCRGDPAIGG